MNRRVCVCMVLLLASLPGLAVAWMGTPPVQRFAPDIEVYPQNFAIAQDQRGVVFVGNNDGLLEFDGSRWSLLRLDNGEIVRSLAIDPQNRVYVGGYNSFGYVERDASGTAHYHELSTRFSAQLQGREFNDIWRTRITPEGVYFVALHDTFLWDPRSGRRGHWQHPGRFGELLHHAGRTLLQFRGEGLRERRGDAWVALPGSESLGVLLAALLPLPDGSLLAIGSDGRWQRLDGQGVQPLKLPPGLPDARRIHAGTVLADGSLALAGVDGVVYLLAADLSQAQALRVDAEFLSGIEPAIDGGFLVSANEAFYRVEWPSAWTRLIAGEHTPGSLKTLADWNGRRYLLGSAGSVAVRSDDRGGLALQPTGWAAEGAYALLALDHRHALLAGSRTLHWIEDDRAQAISADTLYPRLLQASQHHPDLLYLGSEYGLRQLRLRAGQAPQLLDSRLAGRAQRVRGIVEIDGDRVLLGSERVGLSLLRLDGNGELLDERALGAADGIDYATEVVADVARLGDGRLIASTRAGLFEWRDGRLSRSELGGLEALRPANELLALHAAANGELWAYSATRVFRQAGDEGWQEQPLHSLREGAVVELGDWDAERVALVTGHTVLLHDGGRSRPAPPPPPPMLTGVQRIDADGRRRALPLAPQQPLQFVQGDFALGFQFTQADLRGGGQRSYQKRLLGYQAQFTEWSDSRSHTYNRLRPGSYTFEARSRDGQGRISAIPPYRFEILAPWYAGGWAQLGWILLALLALGFGVRWRTRRLQHNMQQLESLVAARTSELNQANRQLQAMAHIDVLTGLANRRRLDQVLASTWAHTQASGRPLALLVMDVDRFKDYNDQHGHVAGDELLRALARVASGCLRRSEDLLARYGGEEFMAVLPGAELVQASAVGEAMRAAVEAAGLGTTLSVGVAASAGGEHSLSELVQRADAALYRAKQAGRNRVVSDPGTSSSAR